MTELIDKWGVVDKLTALENECQFHKPDWDAETLYRKLCEVEIEIGKTPAVEAEPVVHARWVFYEDETGDWYDKCSRCGGKLPNEGGYCCGLPRCPECGAHMDEEVANVR